MSISVACSCGAKLRADDDAAGKTVACPKCKTRLKVPSPGVPGDPPMVPIGPYDPVGESTPPGTKLGYSVLKLGYAVLGLGVVAVLVALVVVSARKNAVGNLQAEPALSDLEELRKKTAELKEQNRQKEEELPPPPPKPQPFPPPQALAPPKKPAVVVAFRGDPAHLYTAYTANEANADLTYTGKQVEIVINYNPDRNNPVKDRDGDYVMHVCWVDDGLRARSVVVAVFLSSETKKLAGLVNYPTGREIVVRGVCRGFTGGYAMPSTRLVQIDNAVLIVKSPQEIEQEIKEERVRRQQEEEKARQENEKVRVERERARLQREEDEDRDILRKGQEALQREEAWRRNGYRGVDFFQRQRNLIPVLEMQKMMVRRHNAGKPPLK